MEAIRSHRGIRRLPIAFAVCLLSAPAFGQTSLYLRDAIPDGEGYAVVDVVVESDGRLGGFQADIFFDNTILELAARDCRINPAIGLFPLGLPPAISCLDDTRIGPCKTLASVRNQCGGSPQAEGCPAAAVDTLSVFRGVVVATGAPNNNVVPNGVAYSCRFRVLDASRLPTRFRLNNVVASDPYGTRLTMTTSTGVVCDATGDCGSPSGCLGDVECESLRCEPAAEGGYPGRCAGLRTPTPTATVTEGTDCNLDSDCSSGNCDTSKIDRSFAGTCGPPFTPPPIWPTSENCEPARCSSGYCANDVCCDEADCRGSDRCDIRGFEGRCVPPLPQGAVCNRHSDCSPGIACIVDDLGIRRCTILHTLPTFIPTRTAAPLAAPPPPSDDAGDPFANVEDDGCSMSPRSSRQGIVWLVALAGFIGVAAWRRRADPAFL